MKQCERELVRVKEMWGCCDCKEWAKKKRPRYGGARCEEERRACEISGRNGV